MDDRCSRAVGLGQNQTDKRIMPPICAKLDVPLMEHHTWRTVLQCKLEEISVCIFRISSFKETTNKMHILSGWKTTSRLLECLSAFSRCGFTFFVRFTQLYVYLGYIYSAINTEEIVGLVTSMWSTTHRTMRLVCIEFLRYTHNFSIQTRSGIS